MITNRDTVIIGDKVVLVPYLPEHVPTYHGWMCSEELRLLTASEPLTLEEEYDMQQKWLLDDDKLTFIILARDYNILPEPPQINSQPSHTSRAPRSPADPTINALRMIGDVNMFLKGTIPEPPYPAASRQLGNDQDDHFEAEVEIMVAEPSYRRKGVALETLQLMLRYATGAPSVYFGAHESTLDQNITSPLRIPPESLVARISEANIPSIRLFEKLGFKVTKKVEVFGEVEMRWFRPVNQ